MGPSADIWFIRVTDLRRNQYISVGPQITSHQEFIQRESDLQMDFGLPETNEPIKTSWK